MCTRTTETDRLYERIDKLLEIATRHKLSVMLTTQPSSVRDPHIDSKQELIINFRPGVHAGHIRFPGVVHYARYLDNMLKPVIKDFVQSVLRRYSKDERIIAWDLFNEPKRDDRPLVEFVFSYAREVNPSQPLVADQFECQTDDLVDVYTFHTYAPPGGPPISTSIRPFHEEIKLALESKRPMLCTECLARSFGNTLRAILPHFSKYNIGWYVWGLCAGSAQYHYPWGWPIGSPEPKLWFHCLLYPDGTPYNYEEIELIRSFKFRVSITREKLSENIADD